MSSPPDVFISHASEDKDSLVRPLASALKKLGVSVWYDEFSLRLGDSLSESVDRGLAQCRFGVVVISEAFIRKQWTRYELRGLVSRETVGSRVILPIWHGVTHEQVLAFSPPLADKVAISTTNSTAEDIAQRILQEIRPDSHRELTGARIQWPGEALPEPRAEGRPEPLRVAIKDLEPGAAIPVLLKLLSDPDPSDRRTAVETLATFEPEAAQDLVQLADLIAETYAAGATIPPTVVYRLYVGDDGVKDVLCPRLEDVERLGPAGAPFLLDVIRLGQASDYDVQTYDEYQKVLRVLMGMRPFAQTLLVIAQRHGDPELRQQAKWGLEHLRSGLQ